MSLIHYKNVQLFAEKWRKFTPVNPILTDDEFKQKMQSDQRIEMHYTNTTTARPVRIYLFAEKSKYVSSSADLRGLLLKIKEPTDIILITKDIFKVYGLRVINSIMHLRIISYLHEHFSIELPLGPLCYRHRIMSKSEIDYLLNQAMFCKLINLPKISVNDPQCRWIGAEIGDVIEITMPSDIVLEVDHYRVVVPGSGKNVSFNDPLKPTVTADAEVEEVEETGHEADQDDPIDDGADDVEEDDAEVDE